MVYITGDMHGDAARFKEKAVRSLKKGDTLIICGDFGFVWNGTSKEKRYLQQLGKQKYEIAFLDGAHENYHYLAQYPVIDWKGGKARQIAGGLVHLMRGQVYEIEGDKYFTFGGGESPDTEIRREQDAVFDESIPSSEEMEEGMQNLQKAGMKVDYILTHEPPAAMRMFLTPGAELTSPLGCYLDQVAKQCAYTRWFFGCCHIDKPISAKTVSVFTKVWPVTMETRKKK